jgi:hypothetical protein
MSHTTPRLSRATFEVVGDLLYEVGDLLDLDDHQRHAVAKLAVDTLAPTNGAFRRDVFAARVILGERQWAVSESTPGYLADSEPARFSTKRQAERYAVELVGELRADGYRVSGSAKLGIWHGTHPERIADLGRVVEVYDLAAML